MVFSKESSFEFSNDTLQLYKKYVGIQTHKELAQHLSNIQQELLKGDLLPYKCIQSYKFATSRLYHRFFYQDLIRLGKELEVKNEEPYLLDIGCCTGTDLRQLMIDGYPKKYLVGMDIIKEYIKIGYDQFKDEKTCSIDFIIQDIFKIKKDNPLCNKFNIIHTGSVFHLFENDKAVAKLLEQVTLLLKPGGVLVGGHVSSDKPIQLYRDSKKSYKYLMDSAKFTELLTSNGFHDIKLESVPRDDNPIEDLNLFWFSFYAVYRSIA